MVEINPAEMLPCMIVTQGIHTFYLTKMKAITVTQISYAAIRRQSDEEGAVQRVLNTGRISHIKRFVIEGGNFPNAMVLNWVNLDNPLTYTSNILNLPAIPHSAQIIDGQHRIAGIRAAISEAQNIGDLELPVVIYIGLSTQECADIFLAINTEQKPAPRSLVYDLYGVASEEIVDIAAARALDIVMFLYEEDGSPYKSEIKLPGQPTRKGGIALSTAVSAIKPLVEEKGVFEQIDIRELQLQKQIVLNLFLALQEKYKDKWWDKTNAFMYASGFTGAIDFLMLKLVPYCNNRESFTVKTISDALKIGDGHLILQSEVKGLGGKEAAKKIQESLVENFDPKIVKKAIEI
jgi:DNA sulfur modification protein DndB